MLFRASVALFAVMGYGLSHCHGQEQVVGAALAPIVPANAAFQDSSSYALGFNVGSSFAQRSMTEKEIDSKDFLQGLLDALSKKECKLDQKQLEAAFQALDQRMQKKMLELAKENMERAKAHLETNKKKDGVQTTKTGLQYEVLKTGNGKTPTLTDTVVVHYEGKLLNGIVFDSSIARNQPMTHPVSKFVPGWTEALQRMKVGDKWLVTIPPSLGYGEEGFQSIGPNELLIFELELLDVVKK